MSNVLLLMAVVKFLPLIAIERFVLNSLGLIHRFSRLLAQSYNGKGVNDCEAEASETQVWIKFAVKCGYIEINQAREIYSTYNVPLHPPLVAFGSQPANSIRSVCKQVVMRWLYTTSTLEGFLFDYFQTE